MFSVFGFFFKREFFHWIRRGTVRQPRQETRHGQTNCMDAAGEGFRQGCFGIVLEGPAKLFQDRVLRLIELR